MSKRQFDEGIHTPIVTSDNEDHDLEIRLENETCLEFYLDGKKVFGGDWDGNLRQLFELALKKWSSK
jgi:hypothetical protein